MNNKLKPHLAVLTANIIYGVNFSIAKELMEKYIPPFGFIVMRVFFAFLIFWLFESIIVKEKVKRSDLPMMAVLALFGVAINQLLFFKGLSLTSPINAALMMTTNGVQVLVIAAIVLKERIPFIKIIGIVLGIAGAVSIILYGKSFSFGSKTAQGDLCVFLNSLSYAYFLIIAKPYLARYHALTVMKWVFFFGLLMVIPFGFGDLLNVSFSTIPITAWWGIAFVIIGSTFFAYLLNIYGLQRLHSSVVSSYIYAQPALATLFSILFAQGHPEWIHLFSSMLIFSGVYLVSRPVKAVVNK